jgi:hypothetical protein
MKKLLFIPFLMLFSFCNCQKNTVVDTKKTTVTLKSNCPEDGNCTLEVVSNKTLNIKKDDLGSTYYELIDSKTTSVIVYQYKRDVKGGLKDSGYTEEVLFEINNSDKKLAFTNSDLQKVKMIFGRLCFCRGQSGYFEVTDGTLSFDKKQNEIQFDLNFKINPVPQIINAISANIK